MEDGGEPRRLRKMLLWSGNVADRNKFINCMYQVKSKDPKTAVATGKEKSRQILRHYLKISKNKRRRTKGISDNIYVSDAYTNG